LSVPAANVLQPLIDVAIAVLDFFHDELGFGWGLSIIALTFATRLVILPLTIKQLRGMRALQVLQPQMKEIQEKYKNDRQRLQQEMMKFYKDNEVNPLSSCMPLLLQLPVFITLFYALRSDLRYEICGQTSKACGDIAGSVGESFLFIPDLTGKATGAVLATLVILYIVTQLGASAVTAVSAERTQQLLMYALPFIFVPFIITFPAGLVLYWITTNVWTFGQQLWVRRFMPPPNVPTPEEAAAARPPPPPPRKKKKRR
jgi:YidC/Oxa1 family membrane protein insertase